MIRTLGVIGGGQLGRMFALDAKRMGYDVITLDPQPRSPCGQVADEQIVASYDDLQAIERLGEHGYEFHNEDLELRALVDGAVSALAEKEGMSTQGWSVDIPSTVRVTGDGEMLRRGIRVVCEHMAQGGAGQAKLSIVGHAISAGSELVVRSSSPPVPMVPASPEERPSGDPAGRVLGYALAQAIIGAHGGSLQQRDDALVVTLPKR